MKVKTILNLAISLIVMCVVSIFVINPNISASAEITETSLKLVCKTDEIILSGMDWNLYKVSSTKEDNIYKLEGDFSNYRVSLKNLSTTSEMLDVANTLENYAIIDEISPINSGSTDKNGVVSFADLDAGLYLISGKSVTIDSKKYTPSAMLIEVEEGKQTAFELVSYPKFTVKTLSNKDTKYTVKKVWLNDEKNLEDRPNDIVVELYKDGQLSDTVSLNDSNDWEYSWHSSDVVEWRVKEVLVPENYMVIYRNDEVVYLVVNIHTSEDENQHNNTNSNTQSIVTDTGTTTVTSSSGVDVSKTTTTPDVPSVSKTTTTTPDVPNVSKTTTSLVSNISVTSPSDSDISGTDVTTTTTPTDTSNSGGLNVTTIVSDTKNTSNANNGSDNNSKSTNKSTTNGSTVENISKLPQTGQLWWPVPILIVSGVVFIAIGVQLKSRK